MFGDSRYTVPNAQRYPAVTRRAIFPYYAKLVAAFGKVKDMPVGIADARWNRPITTRRTKARACWASTKETTGHDKGWGRMIHDASHYVFGRRHPNARPHDGGHSTLEREMTEYVARKGWPVRLATVTRPKRQTVTRVERLAHTQAAILRWERKAKRAATALKKLNRRARALARAS